MSIKLDNPPTAYGQMIHEWLVSLVQAGKLSREDFGKVLREWYDEPAQVHDHRHHKAGGGKG